MKGLRVRRVALITVLAWTLLGIVVEEPASAVGVAVLQTGEGGGVSYRGGPTDNDTFAYHDFGGQLSITDPLVVIVPIEVTLGPQNCSVFIGAAECAHTRFGFSVFGELGNDKIFTRAHPDRLNGAYVDAGEGDDQITVEGENCCGIVICGPGFDTVTATPTTQVYPDCEVVHRV